MIIKILIVICITSIVNTSSIAQTALGSEFTYQGELQFSNVVANGVYDFKFVLFDAQDDGNGINLGSLTIEDVQVTQGVFTTQLDFGSSVFVGDKVWMEINVREGALTGGFQQLLPRQEITSAPYAIHAQFVGADAVTGIEIQNGSITTVDLSDNSITADKVAVDAIGSSEISANAVGAIELADNAVDTLAVQDNAITADKIATGAVGTNEIISSQVQRRVTGTCDNGFYLRGINEDGSLLCEQLPFGLDSTLDSADQAGLFTDIAIRPATGFPIVSYYKVYPSQLGSLNIIDCSNASCSTGTIRILENNLTVFDGGFIPELFTSIAVRSNGFPIIAYSDMGTNNLKVYDCFDSSCATGIVRVLDVLANGVAYPSISVRSNDFPMISYYDSIGAGRLKIYDCTNTSCSTGTARQLTVDADGDSGKYNSIVIDPNDLASISYYNDDINSLQVHHCLNSSCTSGFSLTLTDSLQGDQGKFSSIQLFPSAGGAFFISFFDDRSNNSETDRMKILFCSTKDCSSAKFIGLTDQAMHATGLYTSIATRENNFPIISYYDQTLRDLKVYDCTNNVCSTGIVRTLVDFGDVGEFSNITIGIDGFPIISYYDFSTKGLKVYKCGDERCKF